MNNLKLFKRDLKVLLKKHNATLYPMMEGDTFGIHDEHVGVSFILPKKAGDNFAKITEVMQLGEDNVSSNNI